MFLNPLGEVLPREVASCKIEHEAFLIVDGRQELEAIQHQESLHRRMGHALVAIKERVVKRQRESERRRFSFSVQRGVEVSSLERGAGLREGGFQGPKISNAGYAARA